MRIIYPIEERDLMTKTESYKQPLTDIFRCPIRGNGYVGGKD